MTTLAWSRRAPLLAALALGVRLVGCGSGSSGGAPSPVVQTDGGHAGSGEGLGASGATSAGGTSNASGGLGGTGGAAAGGGGNGGTTTAGGASSGMAGVSGGGCAGVGNGSVPPPSCKMQTSTITYSTLDECGHAVTGSHVCPSGCVFASQHSVKCQSNGQTPPFRTCAVASDCGTEQYCSDNKTAKLLDSPSCTEGVCDWLSTMTENCNLGCFGGSCSDGGGGSTSASFPWATPATCDGKTITYYFGTGAGGSFGAHTATHECEKACFTDAKGVGCDQQTGEPPFHTCMGSTDCPAPGSQCVSGVTTTATLWIGPHCPDGSCVWKATEAVPCPSGTFCQVSSCQ